MDNNVKISQLQQLTQMEAPKSQKALDEEFKFTLIRNIDKADLKEKLSGQSAAAKKHHTLKPSPHSEKQWYYQAIIISNWPPGEPQSDNKKE